MDVKPKGLLRRLVDLAVSEIERRARASQNPPWLPSERPLRPADAARVRPEQREPGLDISAPLGRDAESARGSLNLDATPLRPGHEPPAAVGHESRPSGVDDSGPAAPDAENVASLALDVTWLSPNEASVRWELAHEDIENARALGHEAADLTLRTVSFRATQTGVMREVSDQHIAGLRGEVVLARLRERRMIVSVGLSRADEFCSIAHVEVR